MTATPYPAPPCPGDETDPEPPPSGQVTLTASQLAATAAPPMASATAERLLAVAALTALRYAPRAPNSLLNESVIRYAGYLHESGFGGVRSETLGAKSVERVVNHAAMFRNSGAAGLLTHYKIRRAGHVG